MTRILALRFHAIGDAIIPIRYLAELASHYPDYEIDYLVPREVAELARAVKGIRTVYSADLRFRGYGGQMVRLLPLLPRWMPRRYDVVVDLQNNPASRTVAGMLGAAHSARFDRFSRRPAAERTIEAIRAAGLDPELRLDAVPARETRLAAYFRPGIGSGDLLDRIDVRPDDHLIVLNPASAMPSRRWPDERYAAVAEILSARLGNGTTFLLLGVPAMKERFDAIAASLPGRCTNLVGKTSLLEAAQLVSESHGMISEDSALMHLGWLSAIPLVALMGASPSYWARPLGERSVCLDSSNLECAWCLEEECPLGHSRCLTQYEPEQVANELLRLMAA